MDENTVCGVQYVMYMVNDLSCFSKVNTLVEEEKKVFFFLSCISSKRAKRDDCVVGVGRIEIEDGVAPA
jgi:hypothetical protein